jgi:DNA invertase Pin-like site-specific DNA recombinase
MVCEAVMAEGKWVVYLRVSTKRQGRSGLGLEAQQAAVSDFLNGGGWQRVCDPFIETESGKNADRPELQKALAACRVYGAKLLIAKLDRLSRNAHFLLGLEQAGVDFVCADMPSANRLTVGIMAMIAEEEGRAISRRTKEALAAAKRRGTVLGGYRGAKITRRIREAGNDAQRQLAKRRAVDLLPIIKELQGGCARSFKAVADGLNARNIPTAHGGKWQPTQVMRVLARQ